MSGPRIADLPFFAGLSPEEVDRLKTCAQLRAYKKGERIQIQGDPAKYFHLLLKGWVKLYRDTLGGQEAVLGMAQAGDSFGAEAILEGSNYACHAEAVEPCQVLSIAAANLRKLVVTMPGLSLHLMRQMIQQMNQLQMENEHMALMTAPQRIGCFFLKQAQDCVGNKYIFRMPYDKALAAASLGMKPETFSRALSQLKQIGVTTKGDAVIIDDMAALADYCCTACSALDGDCRFSRSGSCEREACTGRRIYEIE